ncbi:serine/threonine-protein kinase 11-interacting protein, partial [Clarias magur]
VLLELLSKVALENEQQADKEKTATVRLQCLKCHAEFAQVPSNNLIRGRAESDVYYRYPDKTEKERTG